jgi:Ca-activated chloride channel homolog
VRFEAGWRLWLLLGVAGLALAYVLAQLRRSRYVARFTNVELLGTIVPRHPGWRRHVTATAALVGMGLVVVGFAEPVRDEEQSTEQVTIVLALDVSLSMMAEDVSPDRLAAAKEAAIDFVESVPDDVAIVLVDFAGSARVRVAATTDKDELVRAIESLHLREGTAIGEAIFTGLDTLADLVADGNVPDGEGEDGDDAEPLGRIVLLSDGETTAGRPNEEAVAEAVELNVPVTTIAFGTQDGVIEDPITGEQVPVPVNGPALEDIADETGGDFFEAGSADELIESYEDIAGTIQTETVTESIADVFLGFALAALAAATVGSLVWSNRLW